jgi:hypothetical protein
MFLNFAGMMLELILVSDWLQITNLFCLKLQVQMVCNVSQVIPSNL